MPEDKVQTSGNTKEADEESNMKVETTTSDIASTKDVKMEEADAEKDKPDVKDDDGAKSKTESISEKEDKDKDTKQEDKTDLKDNDEAKGETESTSENKEKEEKEAEQEDKTDVKKDEANPKTESASEENQKEDKEKKDDEMKSKTESKDTDKDTKPEEKNEDEEAIVRKVADRFLFFFSDANLRFDRFMRNHLETNSNHMSFSVLLKFNSINKITTDAKLLTKAVEKYCSELLIVKNDGLSRKVPFDMDKERGKNVDLSLVVDNLPVENGRYGIGFTELGALFEQYGKVTMVKMRYEKGSKGDKKKSRDPQGCAFVEFQTKEELAKAVDDLIKKEEDGDAKRKIVVKGNELGIMLMKKWVEEKKKYENKDEDKNDNKRKREDKEKEEEKEIEIPEVKIEWKKGCVISLKGLPEDCDREGIIDAIKEYQESCGGKPYVDYSRGQKDGAVRFNEPYEKIKEVASKLNDGDIKIYDEKVTEAKVLEGEEEEKYWKDFMEFKKKKEMHRAASRNQRRPRNNWGRKRGRRW